VVQWHQRRLGSASSSPGPAQWVKDLALLQLQLRSQAGLGSDLGPGTPYASGQPKKKEEEERKEKNQSFVTLQTTSSLFPTPDW